MSCRLVSGKSVGSWQLSVISCQSTVLKGYLKIAQELIPGNEKRSNERFKVLKGRLIIAQELIPGIRKIEPNPYES